MKRPEFIKKSLFGIFAGITIPSFATSKEKISERIITLKNNIGFNHMPNIEDKNINTGIDDKLINKTEIVYPSIHELNKVKKKDKKIIFVGKLNKSKMRNFCKAIIKILDEFKEWQAYSIGDEKRNRPIISHPRHFELVGFNTKKF